LEDSALSAQTSNYALLLDLARESSSDKRRDLLRTITSVFGADPGAHSKASYGAFDDIARKVIVDLTLEVRSELARNFADSGLPLQATARQLAFDEIEIARPVLEKWNALSEADLLEVVATKSQSHMIAVTRRSDIGENLSAALVERGEDKVVASLLTNTAAKIGRQSYEKISERAKDSIVLQAPLVQRKGVPVDILSDIYDSVAVQLRQEILKRYDEVPPAELEAALERSRARIAQRYSDTPADFEIAQRRFKQHERANELTPMLMVRLMREGPKARTLFLLVLARLTDSDYETVARVFEQHDVDALALLCRAANFDRPLFVTLSLAVAGEVQGTATLEEFGALYEKVPVPAAQRAMRFWRLRSGITASA
jgi:uncharacterized protein (DUF2336 family)